MKKFWFALSVLWIVFMYGCEQEGLIGNSILPESDKLQLTVTDDFEVFAVTQKHDTVALSNRSNIVFGIYEDDVFGRTQASWAAEFMFTNDTITFGDDAKLDSLTLYLMLYSDAKIPHYGVAGTQIGMNIYELTEIMPRDSVVELDYTVDGKYNTTPLVTRTFSTENQLITINQEILTTLNDSVDDATLDAVELLMDYEFESLSEFTSTLLQTVDGEIDAEDMSKIVENLTYKYGIKIKLPQSFVDKLNTIGLQGNISYINWQENFLNGLYFEPFKVDNKGTLIQLKLSSTDTKLRLDYHQTQQFTIGGVTKDSTVYYDYDTYVNAVSSSYNFVEHNYSNTDFYSQINSENPTEQDLLYLQGTGGLRLRVQFPDLREKLSNVNINKADLILNVVENSFDTLSTPVPYALYVYNIDNEGNRELMREYSMYSSQTFASSPLMLHFDEEKERYVFNLAHYVQQMIDNKIESQGIYIHVAAAESNIGRAIIHGTKNATKPMKLEVHYTNIINSNFIH